MFASCPVNPGPNIYADLHYTGGSNKYESDSSRRHNGGGNNNNLYDNENSNVGRPGGGKHFNLKQFIPGVLGIGEDKFEAACKTGWIVDEKLGQGSYGVVHRISIAASVGKTSKTIQLVVKTLYVCPNSDNYARREFEAHKHLLKPPAAAASDIKSVTIPAFALGSTLTTDGYLYHIFFPAVNGSSLETFVNNIKYSPIIERTALRESLIDQLRIAVKRIHARGILHRDIKPANIFIQTTTGPNGSPQYKIRLIDFGLGVQKSIALELPGTGTRQYFSPEHLAAIEVVRKAEEDGTFNKSHGKYYYRYTEADDNYAVDRVASYLTENIYDLPVIDINSAAESSRRIGALLPLKEIDENNLSSSEAPVVSSKGGNSKRVSKSHRRRCANKTRRKTARS
jgi:serine/threonine protein kinase